MHPRALQTYLVLTNESRTLSVIIKIASYYPIINVHNNQKKSAHTQTNLEIYVDMCREFMMLNCFTY